MYDLMTVYIIYDAYTSQLVACYLHMLINHACKFIQHMHSTHMTVML